MAVPWRDLPGRIPAWLRAHDPGLVATRRAARTALVMPALFALCSQVLHSATMATYAAFGSFSMLLLVEFTGPMVQRLRAHAGLAVAWAVLICVGTLVARTTWLAVAVMVVVGFLVLFSGVVSSVLAGATTALLLAFILPVTSPAPLSQLPERLERPETLFRAGEVVLGRVEPAGRGADQSEGDQEPRDRLHRGRGRGRQQRRRLVLGCSPLAPV
ncbi:hypothetical protein R5A26_48850, partial [Streptomyces prunicolor]|nr:hypothetical protein [Streptomyces prunicolor]